jgi:hypothetical protein
MRPAEMVLISDGISDLYRLYPQNPVVVVDPAKPARDYDFKFLADLEVEIVTEGSDRRAQALAVEVARVQPWYLRVWFYDTPDLYRIVQCGEWDVRREHAADS